MKRGSLSSSCSSKNSKYATIPAFAFRVSKIVSINMMWAPPRTKPLICSLYASFTVSKSMFLNDGSSTFGATEHEQVVGPNAPATSLHLSSVDALSASSLASHAAVMFISMTSSFKL